MNDVKIGTNRTAAQVPGTSESSKPSFRLSDIHKLMKGRYGGACLSSDAERYLMASIPELMPKGRSWRYAVAWAQTWVPALLEERGEEFVRQCWIQVAVRKRRHLPTDQLACLLKVADDEPTRLNLRCIPAMSRNKNIRVAERKVKKAQSEAARRAKRLGHTPRSESLKAKEPWVAAGKSRTAWYEQRKIESLMAVSTGPESADLDGFMDAVSDTPSRTNSWTPDPLHSLRSPADQNEGGHRPSDNDNLSRDALAA